MYINTFKYTPKDVSCQLCTEYVKKLGCTALRCPWLAERIEAGVVGYREAVLETFPHERRLFQRLNLLIKHYPGSLWSNEQHERRMQYQCAVQGYRRRRDTNAYYAAMYLLTSNDDIYRRTANCFCKDGIEFGYAVLKNTSPHNYALFMAARDLLPESVAALLRARKKASISQWIFPQPTSPELPMNPGTAYRRLKTLLEEAGLPSIRFHDLRHTFATHALTSGVDAKTLAGILGHTNASFTLDTYTHVTPDMREAAGGIVGGFMEDLFGKELKPWQRSEKQATD